MNVSADFLQQVRDECYNKSLKCLEATDFIGEHQVCKALLPSSQFLYPGLPH